MQSALLKTLPEKGYNPVPQSWQEIGQALHQCMKACAKARRYVSLDPTSTTRKDCLKSNLTPFILDAFKQKGGMRRLLLINFSRVNLLGHPRLKSVHLTSQSILNLCSPTSLTMTSFICLAMHTSCHRNRGQGPNLEESPL